MDARSRTSRNVFRAHKFKCTFRADCQRAFVSSARRTLARVRQSRQVNSRSGRDRRQRKYLILLCATTDEIDIDSHRNTTSARPCGCILKGERGDRGAIVRTWEMFWIARAHHLSPRRFTRNNASFNLHLFDETQNQLTRERNEQFRVSSSGMKNTTAVENCARSATLASRNTLDRGSIAGPARRGDDISSSATSRSIAKAYPVKIGIFFLSETGELFRVTSRLL